MKIKFDYSGTTFTIRVDSNQYTLAKVLINEDKKSKNFGKETEHDLGYFTEIEHAISKIMKVGMSTLGEDIGYSTFIEYLEKYKKELTETLSVIKK